MSTKILTGDSMQGFYILSLMLIGGLIVDPELTTRILTAASVKLQVWIMNLRLKWASWRAYRELVKFCKDSGFPEPGPFRYVDIWERDR